jgi:Ca2+-binding RTX toxin-like protein
MAVITAKVATNFASFSLKALMGGDTTLSLYDNINFTSAQGYLYQDLARAAAAPLRFDFAGNGLTVGGGALTGGTVTGLLAWGAGSSGYTPTLSIEGLSLAAVGAWNAALSATTSDDRQLLDDALWGNDTFNLSAGADRAYGQGGNDTMNGGAGNDTLVGGLGQDSLLGGAGNDWLDGGELGDQMVGGAGNDTYVVSYDGESVVEAANGGTDTVRSPVTITQLAAHVERLVLTGSAAIDGIGNTLANEIVGTARANQLYGGAGNDTLHGMAGNDVLRGDAGVDRLEGGAGNDTYILYGEGTPDVVVETATGGSDTVRSDVSYTLPADVDHLVLTDHALVNGTGNALDNRITGNGVANRLTGRAGNDVLDGSTGNDTLSGGAGRDAFVFASLGNPWNNLVRITDFVAADDTIRIDNTAYLFVGADGALAASAWRIGAAAGDASDRIVYNQATGALSYDSDGSGAGAMLQFAQLNAGTVLTAADFLIV